MASAPRPWDPTAPSRHSGIVDIWLNGDRVWVKFKDGVEQWYAAADYEEIVKQFPGYDHGPPPEQGGIPAPSDGTGSPSTAPDAGRPRATKRTWATSLLTALGAPVNNANIAFIAAWIDMEGTSAAYNPLATTQSRPNATNANSVGVKNYATWDDGIAASVQTLRSRHYPTILAAIMAGNPYSSAGAHSEWQTYTGGGDYGARLVARAQSYYEPDLSRADVSFKAVDPNATPGTGAGAPPDATDDQYQAAIDERFGAFSWLMNDPDVGPLLRQAFSGGMQWPEFQAALQATPWWKSHSDAMRKWDALYSTDGATAAQQIRDRTGDILRHASTLGVNMTQERAQMLAFQSLRMGWRDGDWQRAVAAEARYNPNLEGTLGADATKAKALGAQYGIAVTDEWAQRHAKDIALGKYDFNGLQEHFRNVAKSMFPGFADDLDKGITLTQIASPYVSAAANVLELDPAMIDLTDPKFAAPLSRRKNGKADPMSLDEWATTMMTDPRYKWDHTHNARSAAADIVMKLSQTMGVR